MPLYTYVCPVCGIQEEKHLPMNHKKPQHCTQDMVRDYQADAPNIGGCTEYHKPLVSDSLAVNPDQINEHKKEFPDIEITPAGQPIFTNFKQHDGYLKKTGFRKVPQRIRRKGTKIS